MRPPRALEQPWPVRAVLPLLPPILLALLLWRFPPDQHAFWPTCPVFRYLHVQCPGCGTTRAFAALLRGHLSEALRLNAFTTLLLPFACAFAMQEYSRYLRKQPASLNPLPHGLAQAVVIVAAVFTIVRNVWR